MKPLSIVEIRYHAQKANKTTMQYSNSTTHSVGMSVDQSLYSLEEEKHYFFGDYISM